VPVFLIVPTAIGSVALLAMLAGAVVAGRRWAGLALWLGLIGVITIAVVRR
jgi:hypothetical protein